MSSSFEAAPLAAQLTDAACEVLETMFFASAAEASGAEASSAGARIGAELDFHGARHGKLAISLDEPTARDLAVNFFGDSAAQGVDEDSRLVVAELTNMICGTMLSHLDKHGIFCLDAPVNSPAGAEPQGPVELALRVEEGLLRLALTLEDPANDVEAQ